MAAAKERLSQHGRRQWYEDEVAVINRCYGRGLNVVKGIKALQGYSQRRIDSIKQRIFRG
jgi:hypothetical protein